jgi:hypothetical protein
MNYQVIAADISIASAEALEKALYQVGCIAEVTKLPGENRYSVSAFDTNDELTQKLNDAGVRCEVGEFANHGVLRLYGKNTGALQACDVSFDTAEDLDVLQKNAVSAYDLESRIGEVELDLQKEPSEEVKKFCEDNMTCLNWDPSPEEQQTTNLRGEGQKEAEDLVRTIANMIKNGEEVNGEPYEQSIDDAYKTLANLINKAREIGVKLQAK